MIEEILNNAKMLAGISFAQENGQTDEGDGSADDKLTFYINDIIDAILAYCRIEFLPKQLYGLVAQIAAKMYESEGSNIKSLTEGGRRVEFELSAPSVIGDYYDRLKPFVNIAGRVPSEVTRDE